LYHPARLQRGRGGSVGLENSVLFDYVMLCHLFCSICMRKKHKQYAVTRVRSLPLARSQRNVAMQLLLASARSLGLLANNNLKTAEEI